LNLAGFGVLNYLLNFRTIAVFPLLNTNTMSNIGSPIQISSDTESDAQLLDGEEVSLMQEYEKAKAKLAQIQEKRRKTVLGKREEATASSISKGAMYGEKTAASLDPKGIEHKHVNQATLPSAKNSFDTDNPLLDLNEAGMQTEMMNFSMKILALAIQISTQISIPLTLNLHFRTQIMMPLTWTYCLSAKRKEINQDKGWRK
jgi:hypothetical protein